MLRLRITMPDEKVSPPGLFSIPSAAAHTGTAFLASLNRHYHGIIFSNNLGLAPRGVSGAHTVSGLPLPRRPVVRKARRSYPLLCGILFSRGRLLRSASGFLF